MRKYLVTLEIILTGFIVEFYDTEVEAELCRDRIMEFADPYPFCEMYKVALDFKSYIRKYKIPESLPYIGKLNQSTSNGSLSINIVIIDSNRFNLDFYIADRECAVLAVDLLDEKHHIISDRISEFFPTFYISAN